MAEPNLPATTETETPKAPAVPIPVGRRGLVLSDLDQMWRFAQYVAVSGMAPKGLTDPRGIVVALQLGAELGLTPMASLQNIAVINGRPTIWGDAMLAVCRASGFFDESVFEEKLTGSGESHHATCTVRRLPNGKPFTRSFSWSDAKRAQLTGKQGPWQQYPQRMLQLRARSWALRDGFADVLRGLSAAEESDVVEGQVATRQPAASLQDLTTRLGGDGDAGNAAPADATVEEGEPPKTIDWEAQSKALFAQCEQPGEVAAVLETKVSQYPDVAGILQKAAGTRVLELKAAAFDKSRIMDDPQDPHEAAGDAAAEAIGDQTPSTIGTQSEENPIIEAAKAFAACDTIKDVDQHCDAWRQMYPKLATGIQGQAEKRKAQLAESLPADTPNENDTVDIPAVALDEFRGATTLKECGSIYTMRSQQLPTQEEKDKLHAMSQARQDEIRGSRGAKSNDSGG